MAFLAASIFVAVCLLTSPTASQGPMCGSRYTCQEYVVLESVQNGIELRNMTPPATVLKVEGEERRSLLRDIYRYLNGMNMYGIRLPRTLPLVIEYDFDGESLEFSGRVSMYLGRSHPPEPQNEALFIHQETEAEFIYTKSFISPYDEAEILNQSKSLVRGLPEDLADSVTTIYYAVFQAPFKPNAQRYSEVWVKPQSDGP